MHSQVPPLALLGTVRFVSGDRAAEPAEPSSANQPNLEPIAIEAHPPQNRRMPTQPPARLALDLPRAKLSTRHSPAPIRRGLFASDRITNVLAGLAVGLLLAIYPAQWLAREHEASEVEPRVAALEVSIEHPLAVDAGLAHPPEQIAAAIEDGRAQTRLRFVLVWLVAGATIGLGLGFAPRPGD